MERVAVRFDLWTIVVTGIVVALVFAAFEMVVAALQMGVDAAVMPLRMIGAMVLGPDALEPTYPLINAAAAGVAVHVVLSIVFTAIFAALAPSVLGAFGLSAASSNLAVAGVAYGILLWLVNFYVIAPAAGWTWFPERTEPIVQVVAHAVFFGGLAGWMLGRRHPVVRLNAV
jgi:hypothetical protein